MTDETERLVAEVRSQLKERAKADPRTIKEIVESGLEREFQTTENAAIKRRINECEDRIVSLKREISDRQNELARKKDEKERYESMLNTAVTEEEKQLSKAAEALANTPNDPENPAVQNWAKKCGMSSEKLLAEIEATQ